MKSAQDLTRPLRVLVVEDDLVNQRVTTANLSGHEITMAGTGTEALAALRCEKFAGTSDVSALPDLVLLDLFLPDMTGEEVCRRIRGMAGGAAVLPVVAYTASQEPMDVDSAREAGMIACLGKPLDLQALRQALRGVRPDLAARLVLGGRGLPGQQAPSAMSGIGRSGSARPMSSQGLNHAASSPYTAHSSGVSASSEEEWAGLRTALGTAGWAEAVEIFREDSQRYVAAISAAAAAEDWSALAAAAHKLAGCSGSLQQKALKNHASRLERQCRGPAPTLARNLLAELETHWKTSLRQLEG